MKQRATKRTRFRKNEESACKPGSVSQVIIHLGCTSPHTSSNLPGDSARAPLNVPLFGLAPDGVCPATDIAASAVRSYRTISPLPLQAVYFLWHFPSTRIAQNLSGTLPERSPDFPPQVNYPCSDYPADSGVHCYRTVCGTQITCATTLADKPATRCTLQ